LATLAERATGAGRKSIEEEMARLRIAAMDGERVSGLDLNDPESWNDPANMPAKSAGRLRAIDFDPSIESRPPSWLVKGIAPRTGLGLLYGEGGAGK
jgi:hypothetical protein